jgi:hypothetical protein
VSALLGPGPGDVIHFDREVEDAYDELVQLCRQVVVSQGAPIGVRVHRAQLLARVAGAVVERGRVACVHGATLATVDS